MKIYHFLLLAWIFFVVMWCLKQVQDGARKRNARNSRR
jgi:hypothetical protein